ncbi:hypothetical protein FOL47_001041, partial [Perkinsus chesapeaki]
IPFSRLSSSFDSAEHTPKTSPKAVRKRSESFQMDDDEEGRGGSSSPKKIATERQRALTLEKFTMDKIAHEDEGWTVSGAAGKRKRNNKNKKEQRDLESVESVVSSTPEGSEKSSASDSSNNLSMSSAAPSVEFNVTSSTTAAVQNSLFKSTKELFAPDETALPNFAPEEYIDGAYFMRKGGRHSHTKEQKQEWSARKQREQQFRVEKRNNQREAQKSAQAEAKMMRVEAIEAVAD